MTVPQSGILPDGNCHATFLTLLAADSETASGTIRTALKHFPTLLEDVGRSGGADVFGVVGIGSEFWDRLSDGPKPALLRPFTSLEGNGHTAPSTPGDIHIHVRSDRADLVFEACRRVMALLGNSMTCHEEVHGFRYLDKRDLTGFVDGTENPEGDLRAETALTGESDPEFAGGSYISVQRYIHDLTKWNSEPLKTQEDIIGRTKEENIEYETAEKPAFAHVKRSGISNESGPLRIMRHSMPYGSVTECGLYFISYCFTPDNFDDMLKSMFFGDEEGVPDGLLDYSLAMTGMNYFAPSRDWLESLT